MAGNSTCFSVVDLEGRDFSDLCLFNVEEAVGSGVSEVTCQE